MVMLILFGRGGILKPAQFDPEMLPIDCNVFHPWVANFWNSGKQLLKKKPLVRHAEVKEKLNNRGMAEFEE